MEGNTRGLWGARSCVLLCVLALSGLSPRRVVAAEWNWTGQVSADWHDPRNWRSLDGQPDGLPSTLDHAVLSAPADDVVVLSDATAVRGLILVNGIELDTLGYPLHVAEQGAAATAVAGNGSKLVVTEPLQAGSGFVTDSLLVSDGGRVTFYGGAHVQGQTIVGRAGALRQHGSASESLHLEGGLTIEEGTATLHSPRFAEGSEVRLSGANVQILQGLNLGEAVRLHMDAQSRMSVHQAPLAVAGAHVTMDSGSLRITGGNALEIGARGRVELDGTAQLEAGQAHLRDGGRLTLTGGAFSTNGALRIDGGQLWNETGTLDFQPGADVAIGSGMLVSRVPLPVPAGVTLRLEEAAEGGLLSTPSLSLVGGEFAFAGGRLQVDQFEGDLLQRGGVLAPGQPSTELEQEAQATLRIAGSYLQSSESRIELSLAGGDGGAFDRVEVRDRATLAGHLDVVLASGFRPSPTDVFPVLAAAELEGAFTNVPSGDSLALADGSGSFTVHYGAASRFDPATVVLTDFEARALAGDFNQDGLVDARDMDLLSAEVRGGEHPAGFDLTGDGLVNELDREQWVTAPEIMGTRFGDADLDRQVAFSDFLFTSTHFGDVGGWAEGDFDGSGDVAFGDFLLLSINFGQPVGGHPGQVPEPRAAALLSMALLVGGVARRRRWLAASS